MFQRVTQIQFQVSLFLAMSQTDTGSLIIRTSDVTNYALLVT